MNVLSLFDGMSCGRIALERAGIKVDNYYASEIDKWAIKVSEKNWPDIIHLGDVNEWRQWDIDWSKIDLILAGSPCQGFSKSHRRGKGFEDSRSRLFFVFVDILNFAKEFNPSVKFLLENVKMTKVSTGIVNNTLGVKCVEINSDAFCGQNRPRLYWVNWNIEEKTNYSEKTVRDVLQESSDTQTLTFPVTYPGGKRGVILAEESKKRGGIMFLGGVSDRIRIKDGKYLSRNFRDGGRVYSLDGKAVSLTASTKGAEGGFSGLYGELFDGEVLCRQLTPLECERLQTVPDNYTAGVSNSQRYKMLGNGWTVDVIAHILKGIEE